MTQTPEILPVNRNSLQEVFRTYIEYQDNPRNQNQGQIVYNARTGEFSWELYNDCNPEYKLASTDLYVIGDEDMIYRFLEEIPPASKADSFILDLGLDEEYIRSQILCDVPREMRERKEEGIRP